MSNPTPAEAARQDFLSSGAISKRTFHQVVADAPNWERAAKAAISAHLAQVAEGLPTRSEIIDAYWSKDFGNGYDAIRDLFAERFAKLQAERDELKRALSGRTVSCGACNAMAVKLTEAHANAARLRHVLESIANSPVGIGGGDYPQGFEAGRAECREVAREALTLPPPPVVTVTEHEEMKRVAMKAAQVRIEELEMMIRGQKELINDLIGG